MKLQDEKAPVVPEGFPEPLQQGIIIKRARLAIEGQIYIPESTETPTNHGWVMAVSEDTNGFIRPGMKVLFNSRANAFLLHKEEMYLSMHENDCYAQIKTITHENNGTSEEVLIPFNKSVLLRKGQAELKMPSGIILPDNQKLINYGIVIGVGENVDKRIQVGQKVQFNMYSNFEFMFNGRVVNSMYEVDIQVIMDKDTVAGIAYTKSQEERRADIPLEQLPEVAPKEKLKGTGFHGLDKVGDN